MPSPAMCLSDSVYENLYSASKHGRTVNSKNQDTNTNKNKTKKQSQSGQKTLEAQFKFRHTFGP